MKIFAQILENICLDIHVTSNTAVKNSVPDTLPAEDSFRRRRLKVRLFRRGHVRLLKYEPWSKSVVEEK